MGAIFATAMGMQILPMLSRKDMVTEENFHLRLIVFGGWAAYGVVPTFHWAVLHGGMDSPAVAVSMNTPNFGLSLDGLILLILNFLISNSYSYPESQECI